MEFCGKGVSGGIAIGKAAVFERGNEQIRRISVDDAKAEIKRFSQAKKLAQKQLKRIYDKALIEVGETNAEIFNIHMMMLEDEDYNESVENIILSQSVNAEYAVSCTGKNFAMMFSSMDDAYMRARKADVLDISKRLVDCLSGQQNEHEKTDENVIICAKDLSPSETVLLDKNKVLAFVTSRGSVNSHTAILAGNMNIPAVIGAGDEMLDNIKDGDLVAVDGNTGKICVNPDKETLEMLKEMQTEDLKKRRLLKNLKGKENVTKDGTKIKVFANIGSVESVGDVLYNDAGGIGLFRSEFLFLESDDFPSEQKQFKAYKTVLESMAGKKVIIRTLDIGADKQLPYFGLEKEENPALGFRAVRICLTQKDIFKTQLRALFRASAFGNLSIMFPMIVNKWELEKCLEMCREVKEELKEKGIVYSEHVELGIMIETPAAAIISDELAPLCDFFSVGTNDLTQYTLACDRQNPALDVFCDIHHRAILHLIGIAAHNAHKNGAWIGICGELASDTSLTETFLRMGIDELSVSPSLVLSVREKIRSIDLKQ